MSNFNARDLAMLLPDEVDVVSMRFNQSKDEQAVFEPLKPKIDKSKKVTRYFPNKAPVWTEDDFQTDERPSLYTIDTIGSKNIETDRRLARLSNFGNEPASTGSRRRRYEAEVIEEFQEEIIVKEQSFKNINIEQEEEDDLEDIAAASRRARIKQKMVEKEQEILSKTMESEESEYETDTDSSEEERVILKPVFVPREKRETIIEYERKLEEDELIQQRKLQDEEERKQRTRILVAESVKRLDEKKELFDMNTDGDSDAGIPDEDIVNDEEEFELWRMRELGRLKRDIEIRETIEVEKAETIRRRNLTDEDRRKEDEKLNKSKPVKEKVKWNYLQKYYHKGVFYMDEDSLKKDEKDVRKQEFDAPTLEDKIDKEKLPAILQVKKFGMRGRTKYTHLVDQDTTRFDNTMLRPDKHLQDKYMSKVGGIGDLDNAGKRKKQKLN